MPCKQENNALLYAYGELEETKTKSFLEHLKTCKECQNIVHLCALTSATLAPKQAPEFHMPAKPVENKGFKFGFLPKFKWAYPALVFGAFALILGFTAFEFTTKKPMVSTVQNLDFNFDDVDTDLTDLETEISDLFQYMQEI